MIGRHRARLLGGDRVLAIWGRLSGLRPLPVIAALCVLAVLGVAISRTIGAGSDSADAVRENPDEPAAVTGPAPSTPTARSAVTLPARYSTTVVFDGGYVGQVTITNDNATSAAWLLVVTMPPGVSITYVWAAEVRRTGQTYVLTALNRATLPAGATLAVGFQASRGSGRYTPTRCTVNGHPCVS